MYEQSYAEDYFFQKYNFYKPSYLSIFEEYNLKYSKNDF
jgi:hypothetical protein